MLFTSPTIIDILWSPVTIVLTAIYCIGEISYNDVSFRVKHCSLRPGRHRAIILTNAGILLTRPLGINFNKTLIEIHAFSLKTIHFKISSGKWLAFCLTSIYWIQFTMISRRSKFRTQLQVCIPRETFFCESWMTRNLSHPSYFSFFVINQGRRCT